MNKFSRQALLVILTLCTVGSTATIVVNPDGLDGFRDIQAGIDVASPGDTVLVASGWYRVSQPVRLNKAITVRSESGPGQTVILANTSGSVIVIDNQLGRPELAGFTLSGASDGGIVVAKNTAAEIRDSWITGNQESRSKQPWNVSWGTAIVCSEGSDVSLKRCFIYDNGIPIAYCVVFCDLCSLKLYRCWITGNAGRAIYVRGSAVELTSCLLSDNIGLGHDNGAGIEVIGMNDNKLLTLVNCTITGNTGEQLVLPSSGVVVRNCIVWGNYKWQRLQGAVSRPADLRGDLVEYSCIDGQVALGSEHVRGGPPGFLNAGDWTTGQWRIGNYRLRPNSTCIDAGTSNSIPLLDFEGNPRSCGQGVDLGAFEYCAFLRGNVDGRGGVNLTDAVFLLNFMFLAGGSPPCLDAADADDDGRLGIGDCLWILNYLFLAGRPPPEPGPVACGIDQTTDSLTCSSFAQCP